jgi:hypothetical protein
MIRPTRWIALGLVVAAAACSDIATPIRNDFYEWRLIVPSASGPGNDSLTFHWPHDRLPVRVWVENDASLPENIPRAIAAWRTAFLYGEFEATVVTDSSAPAMIVRWAAPGPVPRMRYNALAGTFALRSRRSDDRSSGSRSGLRGPALG